jgi:hypothetical protein
LNATHDYFVSVLEKVRETLKPLSRSHISIPSTKIQDDYAAASSLFDPLQIEEPSSGLSSAPTSTETLQMSVRSQRSSSLQKRSGRHRKSIWPRIVFSTPLPKSGNLWERFGLLQLLT